MLNLCYNILDMPKKYVLALVVITIIFFGGIFLLFRLISGGGDNNAPTQPAATQKVNKLSLDANKVSYTVYGRVVGEEDRRAIRITVDDFERKLEVLQGYDESVISSTTTSNKTSAFEAFLLALENAGFTMRDTSIKTDDRSLCSLGNRYVFETEFDDSTKIRTWATSCSSKNTSFKGSRTTVETLFKAQIPKYSELTNNIVL